MAILVTGGAGYIGSHTCVELLKEGYEVVVVDNLYNSSEEALNRVKQITGKEVKFYNVDVLDREALDQVFKKAVSYTHLEFRVHPRRGPGHPVRHLPVCDGFCDQSAQQRSAEGLRRPHGDAAVSYTHLAAAL